MGRLVLVQIIICLFSGPLFAKSYEVHDAGTPGAYILRQPEPGVFLGEMMRRLSLKPDWTNRIWIELIHKANPERVDSKGEILLWDQPLVLPLSALKTLPGYKKLDYYLVPVAALNPPPEPEPEVVDKPEPKPKKEMEVIVKVDGKVVTDEPEEQLTGTELFVDLGYGSELLAADNGIGNNSDLNSEINGLIRLGYLNQFAENHQFYINFVGQYKTYEDPKNISVSEDVNFLLNFQYGYGYRLFNQFQIRVVGQHHQQNFMSFPGTVIDLTTAWNNMAGLGFETPLWRLSHYQISLSGAALASYNVSSDFDVDSGFQYSGEIAFEPQRFKNGIRVGAYVLYHDQTPSSFQTHQSTEAFGFVGYQF